MFRHHFESEGLDVVDYLKCMSDLGLAHTFLPLNEERSYYIAHLDNFMELIDLLEDDLSKKTVFARLEAFIKLDRRGLVAISQEIGLFTKNITSQSKLLISNDEIYVDVGAAHGDTISHFYDVSGGSYKKIYAFEPDPMNFKGLSTLCKVIPNNLALQAGVSDTVGQFYFYEHADNRFSSRFVDSSSNLVTSMKANVVRLDDVVTEATLIKIDVEGFETKVIDGAKLLIEKFGPSMYISGYHYPQDLVEIISKVSLIRSYKKTVVRHYGSTLWDTNILFSDRQDFG
jgi:FkbM family methyltransferase